MRKKLMVTSLIEGDQLLDRAYYYTREENGKVLYCEAMMPTEASCKYMLATTNIDKIYIIGSEKVYDPGEEIDPKGLRDGKTLFASNPKELSTYSFLRYRLAEFAEEQSVYYNGDDIMLSDKEKENITAFVHSFFDEHLEKESDKQLNRYFHLLAQNHKLQKKLYEALSKWAPEGAIKNYSAWTLHYLYQKLKDTSKMELLETNSDIQIELVCMKEGESLKIPKTLMESLSNNEHLTKGSGEDIYLCVQTSNAAMILDIINLINLTNIMPNREFELRKTIASKFKPNVVANEILDMTDVMSISELFSGAEAFLKYGKTKLLVEYWKRANIDNPKIKRMIYAMRNIDTGISLCDITDIERGIRSLRELIVNKEYFEGDTPVEQSFNILLEAIRIDYGGLLTKDRIEFIDLVRWAYRKEFWQQTLTLIESRAPQDFVEKGFYFYCDSEQDKEHVTEVFGQKYWDLKSYEKYKMDHLEHYYIKFYNREKMSHNKHGNEYVQAYAKLRADEIDCQDDTEIRACTACPDRVALENLLFAYYYVGNIRNETNHAVDTFDGFTVIMKDSESGERMDSIRQSIDYFLHCYDTISKLVEDKTPNVIYISSDEIMDYVDNLREGFRKKKK